MKIFDTVKIIAMEDHKDRLPCIMVETEDGTVLCIEYTRISTVRKAKEVLYVYENGIPQPEL